MSLEQLDAAEPEMPLDLKHHGQGIANPPFRAVPAGRNSFAVRGAILAAIFGVGLTLPITLLLHPIH